MQLGPNFDCTFCKDSHLSFLSRFQHFENAAEWMKMYIFIELHTWSVEIYLKTAICVGVGWTVNTPGWANSSYFNGRPSPFLGVVIRIAVGGEKGGRAG